MYHSITFGDKNTWDDWGLIPSSRPVFSPPPVRTKYIEIPGADGELDLTTVLTGRPAYGNRVGSFEFIVADQTRNQWFELYSRITNYLHGRRMQAVLEDDPGFFYDGRFSVNQWQSNPSFSTIVIDYSVAPFKKNVIGSTDEWLWDPFDFEEGFIADYRNLVVRSGTPLTVEIMGSEQIVTPTFVTSNAMIVKLRDTSFPLPKGTSKVPGLRILLGSNILTFTGSGTVTIIYRGGSL